MKNIAATASILLIALALAAPAHAGTWRNYLLDIGRKLDGQADFEAHAPAPDADDARAGALETNAARPDAPLLSELDDMVGMEGVAKVLRNTCDQFAAQKQTKPSVRPSLNVAFVGPAGSGKTEVAKYYARALHAVGATKKPSVVVATQADLVAEYVGQTAVRTRAFLATGRGGTIVLDRVGALNGQSEGNHTADFGADALGAIKQAMESWSDDTVFILVDSKAAIDGLRNSRTGILQRVPQTVSFPQLNAEQLQEVLVRGAKTAGFSISERVIDFVRPQLAAVARRDNGGGSAKVRQMLDNAVMHWQIRQSSGHAPGSAAELAAEDFDITQSAASRRPVGERVARASAVLNRLNDMPGLEVLHDQLQGILDELAFDLKNQDGLAGTHRGLNMAFVGPPGTGKTTVAQIFAEALKELGVLQTDTFLVRRPADFISEQGRTAAKARDALDEGRGGITFIDEAYGLVAHRDAGQALEQLLLFMENEREDSVVILAGYEREMDMLYDYNPGFRRRISETVVFPSYDADDLVRILVGTLKKSRFDLDPATHEALHAYFEAARRTPDFGNAGAVRAISERAISRWKARHASKIGAAGQGDALSHVIQMEDLKHMIEAAR